MRKVWLAWTVGSVVAGAYNVRRVRSGLLAPLQATGSGGVGMCVARAQHLARPQAISVWLLTEGSQYYNYLLWLTPMYCTPNQRTPWLVAGAYCGFRSYVLYLPSIVARAGCG